MMSLDQTIHENRFAVMGKIRFLVEQSGMSRARKESSFLSV
jgi:hypothetical protein